MITDEQLRERLAQTDPAVGRRAPEVLGRVVSDRRRRPVLRPILMTAAAVIVLALVGTAVVPQLLPTTGSDSMTATGEAAPQSTVSTEGATDASEQASPQEPAMIRTAAIVSGTQDPNASADRFVQAIEDLGGRVVSQTVVTEGSGRVPVQTDTTSMSTAYPTGPGVWLTVQVPADQYEQALVAARETGQVVRLEQNAQDVTAEVVDTDARIRALASSLAQLRTLMDRAQSVSEVIAVEEAIAQRQADFDALRAQQRELRNATQMASVSVALMSPKDAAAAVGQPSPGSTAPRWALGLALAGGLVIAGVWVTRRRRRSDTAA